MLGGFQFDDIYKPEPETAKGAKEAKSKLDEVTAAARKCLASSDFAKYRKTVEDANSKILDAMITFTNEYFSKENPSTDVYAVKIVKLIQKAQDLKALLGSVDRDAKEK
jgi:hypothetical protein